MRPLHACGRCYSLEHIARFATTFRATFCTQSGHAKPIAAKQLASQTKFTAPKQALGNITDVRTESRLQLVTLLNLDNRGSAGDDGADSLHRADPPRLAVSLRNCAGELL